ncbi:MAG TPA: phosphoribosylanthranilate isomerase [Candidatus Acidoferrales bacterium]|nr:phosphoribosylanthranilate isomerase [Candidatus Acidoferrales bacterium]
MARVKVKICGITNWTDARRAIEAGADLLGFNFYAPSPRYITPAKARRIIRRLPKKVSAVGVFVNESEEKILDIARSVGLGGLQLHGDESQATVERLNRSLSVIKAVRVRRPFRFSRLQRFRHAKALLLDGFDRRRYGGTGRTFNWGIARRANRYGKVFLSGGLTPENVAEAIRVAKPYAVDVCSGVEAKPGKKDPARVKAFMHAVNNIQKGTR